MLWEAINGKIQYSSVIKCKNWASEGRVKKVKISAMILASFLLVVVYATVIWAFQIHTPNCGCCCNSGAQERGTWQVIIYRFQILHYRITCLGFTAELQVVMASWSHGLHRWTVIDWAIHFFNYFYVFCSPPAPLVFLKCSLLSLLSCRRLLIKK